MRILRNYLSTRMGQYVLPSISTAQLDNVPIPFFRPFGMQIVSSDHIQVDTGGVRWPIIAATACPH